MKISVYYLHNFGLPLEDCKNLSTFGISLIDIFFSSKIIRSLPDNVNESFLLAKLTVLEHKIKISSKLFSAIEILLPFNLKAQTLKECKRLKINYVPSEMHQMIEKFHIVHKKKISPQNFENYQNAMKSYKHYHYNKHYQQEFLEIKLLELINDGISDIDLIVNALFEDNKINKYTKFDRLIVSNTLDILIKRGILERNNQKYNFRMYSLSTVIANDIKSFPTLNLLHEFPLDQRRIAFELDIDDDLVEDKIIEETYKLPRITHENALANHFSKYKYDENQFTEVFNLPIYYFKFYYKILFNQGRESILQFKLNDFENKIIFEYSNQYNFLEGFQGEHLYIDEHLIMHEIKRVFTHKFSFEQIEDKILSTLINKFGAKYSLELLREHISKDATFLEVSSDTYLIIQAENEEDKKTNEIKNYKKLNKNNEEYTISTNSSNIHDKSPLNMSTNQNDKLISYSFIYESHGNQQKTFNTPNKYIIVNENKMNNFLQVLPITMKEFDDFINNLDEFIALNIDSNTYFNYHYLKYKGFTHDLLPLINNDIIEKLFLDSQRLDYLDYKSKLFYIKYVSSKQKSTKSYFYTELIRRKKRIMISEFSTILLNEYGMEVDCQKENIKRLLAKEPNIFYLKQTDTFYINKDYCYKEIYGNGN